MVKKKVELEPITNAVIRAADERNKARKAAVTFVTHAALDEWHEMLLLRLRDGLELRIPIHTIREIADEPIDHLRQVKATATGGILFEDIGIALDSNGLLRDILGALSTPAKSTAARSNGRKGGRPHKQAA